MKILSFGELRERKGIGLSRSTLWRMERDGRFPRRINASPSRIGWIESEIDDWLAERAAERDEPQAA